MKNLEYNIIGDDLPFNYTTDHFEAVVGGVHDALATKLNNEKK